MASLAVLEPLTPHLRVARVALVVSDTFPDVMRSPVDTVHLISGQVCVQQITRFLCNMFGMFVKLQLGAQCVHQKQFCECCVASLAVPELFILPLRVARVVPDTFPGVERGHVCNKSLETQTGV